MTQTAYEAQPSDNYLCKPSEIHATLPCEGGILRIGVFFDGTGNSMEKVDTYSNVARLARVYRIDKEQIETRWLYARGVGTDPMLTGDILGNAFGRGAPARLDGALYCLQELIKKFNEAQQSYPNRIILDVFGFSRGAAIARHFVNVIKQGHFNLDAEYQRISKESYRIGFLGVFDTVGSFGMPGDNDDKGFTFHIAPHWLESGGLHIVADDEHRKNFSLQVMLSGQDLAHPGDLSEGHVKEITLPGAHSDIGGGYQSGFSQAQSNNDLGRVALRYMLKEAKKYSVPIGDEYLAEEEKDQEELNFWSASKVMSDSHEKLMQVHELNPSLKRLHRRWRVLEVSIELARRDVDRMERDFARQNQPDHWQSQRRIAREEKKIADAIELRNKIEKEMKELFSGGSGYGEFMSYAADFYAEWAHKSYSPHNPTPGMGAGKFAAERRRAVFYNEFKKMEGDGQFKRLTPRSFRKGVWIDEDAIGQHVIGQGEEK